MAQPVWLTTQSNLGFYNSGSSLEIQINCIPMTPATNVTVKLLNGTLPKGTNVNLSKTGLLTGTLSYEFLDTEYKFAVRAIDDLGNISDKAFTITVLRASLPTFNISPGTLFTTTDSVYIDYQVPITNESNMEYEVNISTGELPKGLEISKKGRITGYPAPPVVTEVIPITQTYTINLLLQTNISKSTLQCSITVTNWELTRSRQSRIPAILNFRPKSTYIESKDLYYDFYLKPNEVPEFKSGELMSFKVIGYDFDEDEIRYNFKNLPLGLTGDRTTGYISGTPVLQNQGLYDYTFSVTVSKAAKPDIVSPEQKFTFRFNKDIVYDLNWTTPSDLGELYNGQISDLAIEATSRYQLKYEIVNGSLPPNMSLNNQGYLVGRVPQQPLTTKMKSGDTAVYNFTAKVSATNFPLLQIQKQFKLTVIYKFKSVYENLYFKATPSIEDRKILSELLNDPDIIPAESVYRPNDNYFGKSKYISFIHAYGIKAGSLEKYLGSITKNHYWRNLILGGIQTAKAKDMNGRVIYEVVYSPIVDTLVNNDGISVSKQIVWPRNIKLNQSATMVASGDVSVSSNTVPTTVDITEIRNLYPASLTNMRDQITEELGENFDPEYLPRWMNTQQDNTEILGYIPAWVIAYVKPGYGEIVKNNILTLWPKSVNQINFEVDRYLVDKTATYDYNTYVKNPGWIGLPSATPEPNPIESKDYAILFPYKTILPKQIDY